jgi:carboxymethylenebutenolidase
MSSHQDLPSDVVGLLKTEPLSRRGFVAASVAGAGYALAAGPVNAQAITTDATGLKTGMASVKVAGGDMPVFFARPEGVANPPVVLVAMEIFGLHEYIRDVTRRLAKLGALAIAPDLFFRAGTDLTKIADFKELMPIVNAKPDAELLADLDATVAWAKTEAGNTDKLGIVGFCRGGRAVWEYAAHSPNLKAGVAFYGSLVDPEPQKAIWPKSPMDLAGQFKAPVLGLYGEADTGIPVAQVEAFKSALAAAKQPSEIVIFPGAPHGFHADYRPSYRKDAADDAWAQMGAWLKAKGVLG